MMPRSCTLKNGRQVGKEDKMEDWIESTVGTMDAVRHELERVRWILYYWDTDDQTSGRLEPGVYEDMKDTGVKL